MKRTAAIAVIAVALLSACSSEKEATTEASASTPSTASEYTLLDGSKVEFDRKAALPQNVADDIQARFDAALIEPNIEAYTAALATEAGPDATVDNFLAFKDEATAVGSETSKYVAGVIRTIQECDNGMEATWAFASQTTSSPVVAACGSADAKAEAKAAADAYLKDAMGGADAWILVEQKDAN